MYPILTVINVNTRFGFAKLLKDKKAETVLNEIKKIKMNNLTTDNGREFLNDKFQKYTEENNIQHFINEPGDHNKLGLIERFNRTIKSRLMKIVDFTNATI